MQRHNMSEREMTTVAKTLFVTKLMDGFWDRWLAHGVVKEDLAQIRPSFTTKEQWISSWERLAYEKVVEANRLKQRMKLTEAELPFRVAGLYYQLVQWIIPGNNEEKNHWVHTSLDSFKAADQISGIETRYESIKVGKHACFGRIRIPSNPKGVVIIINPLDSAKEELFTYEMDFVNCGFISVSFDGPGQGQTFSDGGFKASHKNWSQFVDSIIEFTGSLFPHFPINLFGTSSGASWAIYGSGNAKVSKTVAVSPAFLDKTIRLPDYFLERTRYVVEEGESDILPSLESLAYESPVLLVHGKKDVMVPDRKIYHLYEQLAEGKSLLEYEHEGHCCNYKLPEIRRIAAEWFEDKGEYYEI